MQKFASNALLHKQWTDAVYLPIQRQVCEQFWSGIARFGESGTTVHVHKDPLKQWQDESDSEKKIIDRIERLLGASKRPDIPQIDVRLDARYWTREALLSTPHGKIARAQSSAPPFIRVHLGSTEGAAGQRVVVRTEAFQGKRGPANAPFRNRNPLLLSS